MNDFLSLISFSYQFYLVRAVAVFRLIFLIFVFHSTLKISRYHCTLKHFPQVLFSVVPITPLEDSSDR